MNIILSLFSRNKPDGSPCAKNYPWCRELVELLKANGHTLTQIGADGEEKLNVDQILFNLDFKTLRNLLEVNDTAICVDNFFPHFSNYYEQNKKLIVLFGPSSSDIFGYPTNCNLIKDKRRIRLNQFEYWDKVKQDESQFVKPETILEEVNKLCL